MKKLGLIGSSVVAGGIVLGGGAQAQTQTPAGKIFVVVSSENKLPLKNGNTYPTGYYLNELSVPAQKLAQAGYELVFADPLGNTPSMDVRSDDVKYFNGDESKHQEILAFHDSLTALKNAIKLADVIRAGLDGYDGIFIPGGHAPMTDLMKSRELGIILKYFHQAGKPTALICHGPIAAASAVDDPEAFQRAMIAGDYSAAQAQSKNWIYRGYALTIFSITEETIAQAHLGGEPLYSVESALQTLGGKISVDQQWQSHAVQDHELITG